MLELFTEIHSDKSCQRTSRTAKLRLAESFLFNTINSCLASLSRSHFDLYFDKHHVRENDFHTPILHGS